MGNRAHRINTRTCEDCGEVAEQGRNRRTCERCKLKVCPWCFSHVHAMHIALDRVRRTKPPKQAEGTP